MRVLYDHQVFTIQEYGGISRYFYELIKQLNSDYGVEFILPLLMSNNEYIKKGKLVRTFSFLPGINLQKKIELMQWINEINSQRKFRNNNFDLFHPTYYDSYYLKEKSEKPIVITFHDVIHEKFMAYDQNTLKDKKKVLNRADKIISISENSKNDLMEYYHIPESKISVIHLASSFVPMESSNKGLPNEKYLLYVGTRGHYKNFNFFVTAVAPLLNSDSDLYLYCAGGGHFTKEERSLFRTLRIENKVKLQNAVSDEELDTLYSSAIALLLPSLYEGFGLPLVEAMNCGCPIGASDTSSLPEVAGNAALYFDPYNVDSIFSVVESLINNSAIRSTLKKNGVIRAKEFSWQKTADLTYQVYKSLV